MTTLFLIDTGVAIREFRGDHRAAALLDHLDGIGISAISAMSVFELHVGLRAHENLSEIFDRLPTVPFDFESAAAAGGIVRNNPGIFSGARSMPDAMIAGSAVTSGARLVTLNTRQFSRVRYPGLEVVLVDQDAADWTAAIS